MNLIFGQSNVDMLRQKYTVLDLDVVMLATPAGGSEPMLVGCIIPGDKIPVNELPQLENWIKLHNDMRAGLDREEYNFCKQCIEHLMGKFGGEVDSYYEVVLQRIAAKGTVAA